MAAPSAETALVLLTVHFSMFQYLTIQQGFYFGFLLLSLIFMVMRGYGRIYKQKSALLLSDYLLFTGWVLEAAIASLVVVSYTFGEVEPNNLEEFPMMAPGLKVRRA